MEKKKLTNKEVYKKLTYQGACRLRGDMRAAKFVSEIEGEFVILRKYARSLLYPWSMAKLKYVLQKPVPSLEEGYKEILDIEIPKETFVKLFQQSAAFKRLASQDYDKKVCRG